MRFTSNTYSCLMTNLYAFQGQENDDEIKGDGNSYTTLFRQYDPRLGRWLSIDPLSEKYPEVSPYVSYYNNPLIFQDVKGDSIKLYSVNANTWKVKGWLQTLTNDELTLNSVGTVVIKSKNTANAGEKLTVGTMLIRALISHDKEVNINFNSNGKNQANILNTENSMNGKGSNVVVDFDRFTKLDFNTENIETGNTELQFPKNEIILAHELIHAIRAMDGQSKSQDVKSLNFFKGRNGKNFKENINNEELETVGLKGNYKYTENKIRKEQGEGKRVSYTDIN